MAVLSRAEQAESYIRKAILQGRWKPGERMPLDYELAAELGVGRVTVREAMAPLVREGLIVRTPGVGTVVSEQIDAGTVVVLGSLNNAFSQTGAYERLLLEHTYEVLGSTPYAGKLAIGSGESIEEFTGSLHLFDDGDVRNTVGLISTAHWLPMESFLDNLQIKHVTIVPYPNGAGPVVHVDLGGMYGAGAKILKDHGYDDFALMHVDYSSQVAVEGSRAAEKAARVARDVLAAVDGCSNRLIPITYSDVAHGLAYSAFAKWWASPGRGKCLFVSDSAMVRGVLSAVSDMGIRVPDDLAILVQTLAEEPVAFDVSLARLDFVIREIAETACTLLMDLVEGRETNITDRRVRAKYVPGNSLSYQRPKDD